MKTWNENFTDHEVTADSLTLPMSKQFGTYYEQHWGTGSIAQDGDTIPMRFGDFPVRIIPAGRDAVDISMAPGTFEPVRFELDGKGSVVALVYEEEVEGEIRYVRR